MPSGAVNFVLCRIEGTGETIAAAVAEAQRCGHAQPDARRDIDGTDAADQLAILAQLAFDDACHANDVHRLGVQGLQPSDVSAARQAQRRWRLAATALPGCARVEPVALDEEHPLARIRGPENAVVIQTENSGTLTLAGPGTGGQPTAGAVLVDITEAVSYLRAA